MDTNATITEASLLDSHRGCFACGICNTSGLHLHFDIGGDGIASAVWLPSPEFRSYPDRLHGGVTATLLDCAMVHALFAKGIAGVTAELTIRYLKAVNLLEPLHVSSRVESGRHGVYICRADIHQGGIHAVRAAAKFMDMARPVT